ncbi:hypothetical protein, partial [Soonwooa sp.]|uniref:hypothetical protein n=1 Tax=Soonwooa sp. TaxID=1938592 RepID=UPI0028AC6B0E
WLTVLCSESRPNAKPENVVRYFKQNTLSEYHFSNTNEVTNAKRFRKLKIDENDLKTNKLSLKY